MSCNCIFRQDDYGSVLTITMENNGTVIDISAATTKQFLFEKPDGSSLTKTAQFVSDGTDGKIYYTIETGVLDLVGLYSVQGHIVTPSGEWTTELGTFKVQRIIS